MPEFPKHKKTKHYNSYDGPCLGCGISKGYVSHITHYHNDCLPCKGCGKKSSDNQIVDLLHQYHPECMPCAKCGQSKQNGVCANLSLYDFTFNSYHSYCKPI